MEPITEHVEGQCHGRNQRLHTAALSSLLEPPRFLYLGLSIEIRNKRQEGKPASFLVSWLGARDRA